jgi:hypothetical protein
VHNEKLETSAAAILSTTRTMYFSRCVSFFCFVVSVSFAAGTENALTSAQKADHYADFYNWADSKPFFLAADRGLRRGTPEQIHAHLGYLRATMEERSLPELSNYLASVLKTPTVTSDPRLRVWCLGIKGEVDDEMDSASAVALTFFEALSSPSDPHSSFQSVSAWSLIGHMRPSPVMAGGSVAHGS